MKKKLSLNSLSENAICKDEQGCIIGGVACAQCWRDWEAEDNAGGYSREQALNAMNTNPSGPLSPIKTITSILDDFLGN